MIMFVKLTLNWLSFSNIFCELKLKYLNLPNNSFIATIRGITIFKSSHSDCGYDCL